MTWLSLAISWIFWSLNQSTISKILFYHISQVPKIEKERKKEKTTKCVILDLFIIMIKEHNLPNPVILESCEGIFAWNMREIDLNAGMKWLLSYTYMYCKSKGEKLFTLDTCRFKVQLKIQKNKVSKGESVEWHWFIADISIITT